MTDEKEKLVEESGEQADVAVVDQPNGSSQEAEEAAWKAFPKQVQAAITYAGANKYDYGPKFRNLELTYTVVSALNVADDITRVVLSYRPTTKFRGESGSEYLDIGLDGDVLARRQIRIAKESMPWVLMGIAMLSVIAAFVLVPVILLIEDTGDPLFVAGRSLWIRSGEPKVQAYLTYDAVDAENVPHKWIILPDGQGTSIAWVTVTIINGTSGAVSLAIDGDAAALTTVDGITVGPVNVFDQVKIPTDVETLDRRLNITELPLWGSLVLQVNEQVSGFMAFELPSGSKISSLRWSATDTVTIRY